MSYMQALKVFVVGSHGVGKSCLCLTYAIKEFPHQYPAPTVFDVGAIHVMVDGRPYSLSLWDAAGGDDYERLRPLSYPDTDLFILAVNVDAGTDALVVVREKWMPELRQHCPGVPVLLVGTKTDLREDELVQANLAARGLSILTTEQGQAAAKEIGACAYMECSALKYDNVHDVFEYALRTAVAWQKEQARAAQKAKRRCAVM